MTASVVPSKQYLGAGHAYFQDPFGASLLVLCFLVARPVMAAWVAFVLANG